MDTVTGKVSENRYGMCRSVIDMADGKDKKYEIVVSGLCLVEVCKHPKVKSDKSAVSAYMDADHILVVPVDRQVGMTARGLMQAGHAGLGPQDATHLATAIIANADELHTFDVALLKLSGQCTRADGKALTICKPTTGGPALPLLTVVPQAAVDAKK